MNVHPTPPDLWHWVYWARWWDCIRECLDYGQNLPSLPAQEWSHVDLYEIEDTCIAPDGPRAQAIFTARYPWIENYHITRLRPVRPAPPKKRKRRTSIPQSLNA